MPYFRKKPVALEARPVTVENLEEISEWCHGRHRAVQRPRDEQFIQIDTLEGEVEAYPGKHHVMKGIQGEFYPIRNDILRDSYDEVERP